MSFFAYDRMGKAIRNPGTQVMKALVASVTASNPELAHVSLNPEDGWSLSYKPCHDS